MLRRFIAVEQKNVLGAIGTILSLQYLNNQRFTEESVGLAIIAAGSSTYKPEYSDIDLFLIPETYKNGQTLTDTGVLNRIGERLQGIPRYEEECGAEWAGFNCVVSFDKYEPGRKTGKDEDTHGKQLQATLLKDKFDFEFPRDGREGDLEYMPLLSAEQLIELNSANGAHMIVLARSYIRDLTFGRDAAIQHYRRGLNGFRRIETVDSMLDDLVKSYLILEGASYPMSQHAIRKAMIGRVPGLLFQKFGEEFSDSPFYKPVMDYSNAVINQAIKTAK